MRHSAARRLIAISVSAFLILSTTPVSPAAAPAETLGSVTARGTVMLRGTRVNSGGTMFSGDRLSVAPQSYAKVVLANGARIEMGSSSDGRFLRTANSTEVWIEAGDIAFAADASARNATHLRIGSYDVLAGAGVSGVVSVLDNGMFGVRMLTGSVQVDNGTTKESLRIHPGAAQVLGQKAGQPVRLVAAQPVAEPAAAAPRQGPQTTPQPGAGTPASSPQTPPAATTPTPVALSKTKLALLLGGLAGTTAVTAVLISGDAAEPSPASPSVP